MTWQLLAFALVGLAVGAAADLLLPRLFSAHRGVTVLTGLSTALLTGTLAHAVLGAGHAYATVPISALGACLLVSVLARPDLRTGRPRHANHA